MKKLYQIITTIILIAFLFGCNNKEAENKTTNKETAKEKKETNSTATTAAAFLGKWKSYNHCFDRNKNGKLDNDEIVLPSDEELEAGLKRGMNKYFLILKDNGSIQRTTENAELDKLLRDYKYKFDDASKTLLTDNEGQKSSAYINEDGLFILKEKVGDEDGYEIFKKVNPV